MKYKLGDICEITMGQSPKSEFFNDKQEGVPFLQGIRTFGDRYPFYDTWTTQPIKVGYPGDVIISVRAPVGELNILKEKTCLGRGICAIRMKNGSSELLYYVLKNSKSQLLSKENGTVFSSVTLKDIEKLEIEYPNEIDKQKKIVQFLSMMDNEIEIKKKINKNLEFYFSR